MIQITVTDPSPEEARRAADALLALFDRSVKRSDVTSTPMAEHSADIRHFAATAFKNEYAVDSSLETSEHDAVSLNTATIFGAPLVEVPPGTPFVHSVSTPLPEHSSTPVHAVEPPPAVDPSIAAALQARNAPTHAVAETDSAGMPWDGRIHASTRAKIAGGVWRLRRGIDDATVASVTAELRAAMAAPTATAPPLSVVATTGETATAHVAPPPPPPAAVAPPPPPPATFVAPVPGLTPPPAGAGPMTFPQLMLRITALPPGPETQARVAQAVQSAGLPSLAMLGARADLVPTVAAALGFTQ